MKKMGSRRESVARREFRASETGSLETPSSSGESANSRSRHVGVATTVPAFPGFPLGVTSRTYSSDVFDLTQPLIYNTTPVTGFVALQGGIPQAEAALIAGIQNGETYFNIHTTMFPGGEERDFLRAFPGSGAGAGAGQPGPSRVGTPWFELDAAPQVSCRSLSGPRACAHRRRLQTD
jgi:hypothetical protein